MKSIFHLEQKIDDLENEAIEDETKIQTELIALENLSRHKVLMEYLEKLKTTWIPSKLVKSSKSFEFVKAVIRSVSKDFRTTSEPILNIMKGTVMNWGLKFSHKFSHFYQIDDGKDYQTTLSKKQILMILEDFKKVLNTNKFKSNTSHPVIDDIQSKLGSSVNGIPHQYESEYDAEKDNLIITIK